MQSPMMYHGAVRMPRGRAMMGRPGPVRRPFGRGAGGMHGGRGGGPPPPKWLRMNEPGLCCFVTFVILVTAEVVVAL